MNLCHAAPQVDEHGDDQTPLQWQKRPIVDADVAVKSFFYAELKSIHLRIPEMKSTRPLYRDNICQLKFDISIKV